MEEVKASSLFFTLNIFHSQLIILFQNLRQILLTNCVGFLRRSHNRLNRHLLKAQIRKMLHILGKVQIVTGKGATHIIILSGTALCKLLELGNNNIIAAAMTVSGRTHQVVDLLAAVQTHNHIAHFPIAEIHNFII